MSDQPDFTSESLSEEFVWHPDYTGRSSESVYRATLDDIRRDQHAYHAALDSAEQEEHSAFNTVRDLEKRWSVYDFAWFESDPEQLAKRILHFEKNREARREMIGWLDWKKESEAEPVFQPVSDEKRDWRANLSEDQRRKIASALAVGIMLATVLLCIIVYLLIR